MRLSERAVIAALHVSAWGGAAVDQEVTEEVSENKNADKKDAGTYTKRLISRKALKTFNDAARLATRTHKLLTLPWDDKGARILSTVGYMHYTEQMRLRRHDVLAAREEVYEWYKTYGQQEARQRLGKMFNADEYPSPEEVRSKFDIDVEIKPVPESGDFRAELSDASVKAIVKDIERRTEQRLEQAVNEVFQRISVVTEKMVERLRAYKPDPNGGRAEHGFKDSLVWNIKELADLIPSLNITQDKRLDDLQKRLLRDLTSTEPEILKGNAKQRQVVADKAEAILKKVQSYL